MDELLTDFLTESAEQLDAITARVAAFARDPSDARIVDDVHRLVHGVRGSCGFFDLPRLERIARAAERLTDRLRAGAPTCAETAGLVVATLDRIRDIVAALAPGRDEPFGDNSELIARLERAAPQSPPAAGTTERRVEHARVPLATVDRLSAMAAELTVLSDQLQEGERGKSRFSAIASELRAAATLARALPVARLFARLEKFARRRGAELGARVELNFAGGDLALDRALIEALHDPIAAILGLAIARAATGACPGLSPAVIDVRVVAEAGRVAIEVAAEGLESVAPRAAPSIASHESLAKFAGVVFRPARSARANLDQEPAWRQARAAVEAIGGLIAGSDAATGFRASLSVPPPAAAAARTKSILVVEPTAICRRVVADALARDGFAVVAVADFTGAVNALRAGSRFRAVMADVGFATDGGEPFAQALLNAAGEPAPRLIGLAAHGGAGASASARAAGFDHAVGKFDRAGVTARARAATLEIAA